MIKANNPALESWVSVPEGSDFPIQNLPFGIFQTAELSARAGVAIGEEILDLSAAHSKGYFEGLGLEEGIFAESTLNRFLECSKETWTACRNAISDILVKGSSAESSASELLVKQSEATMLLPVRIGDYTDFYSSIEHATNVGTMFRDPANALLPNWKHIPVGYHGRASSIVISGTPLHRPMGQQLPKGADVPVFGASKLVDFELEMAFITGGSTKLGDRITTENAENHIFGFTLFNDWSARDIQKWEYVPLGPFLAKNFGSSMSPWIVTVDALDPFRVAGPDQDPKVLPYLEYEGKKNFDINLEVSIETEAGVDTVVCNSNYKYMYWNIAQQLAHHSINGCNINAGDVMASGTISGKEKTSYGSMLELSWRGENPLKMNDGTERKFIQDNDTVIMRGFAEKDGVRVGFGEVSGKLLPAK